MSPRSPSMLLWRLLPLSPSAKTRIRSFLPMSSACVTALCSTLPRPWSLRSMMTPIRFRSCLGTTTRTPTPLRWFVPLSTSLRTANCVLTLKSAWGAVLNDGWYRLCWYEHAVIGTTIGYWVLHPSFCGSPWEEGCFFAVKKQWNEFLSIAIQFFNATATMLNCISPICCLNVALISWLAIKWICCNRKTE